MLRLQAPMGCPFSVRLASHHLPRTSSHWYFGNAQTAKPSESGAVRDLRLGMQTRTLRGGYLRLKKADLSIVRWCPFELCDFSFR
jgi:hypothetical protein